MKNFEYESCKEFQMLHFLFQAPNRLRLKSKVNLKTRRMYVKTRFDLNSNFLRLLYENLRIFEHKNCSTPKTLQVFFQEKVQLSHGLKIILNLSQQELEILIISCRLALG